ncbi:MAG: hypothetical protein J6I55_06605 [Ruminococcus sp.]|nr:hypothetical protein [Ruminococcus sp.]
MKIKNISKGIAVITAALSAAVSSGITQSCAYYDEYGNWYEDYYDYGYYDDSAGYYDDSGEYYDDSEESEETTTVSTTDIKSVQTTTTTVSSSDTNTAAGTPASKWYKAKLSDYDNSLHLVSYQTSPEASDGNDSSIEAGANTPGVPVPVPIQTTGGIVSQIPYVDREPEIDAQPGEFAIVTYGWGHGVGLSQNGANFYAEYSGWNYQDILFHYYPDTYLMNTGEADDEEITIAGVADDALNQVAKIVYCEIGEWMNYEAIKAQAVAVYTYCKYHDNDSADLRGKNNPPDIVVRACEEVLGEALYYDGNFALTMFSASSGGITANCNEVFWADLPYLRSVSSDYDAALDPHYGTVSYFSDTYIKNMLERTYKIKLSDDPGNWIQPTYSEETGYVTEVNIDGQKTVRGYDFKLDMGLKSSKFNVYYNYRYTDYDGDDDTEMTEGERASQKEINGEYDNSEPIEVSEDDSDKKDESSDSSQTDETPAENVQADENYYQEPAYQEPAYVDPNYGYDPNYSYGYDYGYDPYYGYY